MYALNEGSQGQEPVYRPFNGSVSRPSVVGTVSYKHLICLTDFKPDKLLGLRRFLH